MTPTDRWGALVEFWDRQIERAESEADRARFQREAADAWACLEFYEAHPRDGFDVVNGAVRWRSAA